MLGTDVARRRAGVLAVVRGSSEGASNHVADTSYVQAKVGQLLAC